MLHKTNTDFKEYYEQQKSNAPVEPRSTIVEKKEDIFKIYRGRFNETEVEKIKADIAAAFAPICRYNFTAATLKGQYRISTAFLDEITRLTWQNGQLAGKTKISDEQLRLLLILLQSADENNKIYSFSIATDILPLTTVCGKPLFQRSTAYDSFKQLQEKGLISVKPQEDGTYSVHIPKNTIKGNSTYVTLQTEYLLHDSDKYLEFMNWTLGAKKIYLMALAQTYRGKTKEGSKLYSGKISLSISALKQKLGVKDNRSIHKYIAALTNSLGTLNFINGLKARRFVTGSIQFDNRTNNYCFSRRTEFTDTQISSFRRAFDHYLTDNNVRIDKTNEYVLKNSCFDILTKLQTHVTGIDITKAFHYLVNQFIKAGCMDTLTTATALSHLAVLA